jgi:hypothetical protein
MNLLGTFQPRLVAIPSGVHHHRHWMTTTTMYRYCTKEDDGLIERGLIVLALQGMKLCIFFYSLYRVYAVPIQDPLDNNTTEGIATNLG